MTLVISAFVHRLGALWFTIRYHFCSYSHSGGRRRWTTLAGLWHFRAGLWVFILFCPTAPFSRGPICAISHWCDGFQALLSVLLIKQNEADCRRWLGADRSRYCNQHTKKPFIKVLSDLKLWIYQSLLTNGIKPSPVWMCLEPALLLQGVAAGVDVALSSLANEVPLRVGVHRGFCSKR